LTRIPIGTSGKTALEIARDAAKMAGRIARDRFEQEKKISFKSPGNIVTDVDTEVEAKVFDLLRREFPNHTLVGEESAADVRADTGYAWIVDPVDGTRNYALGIPIYSTVVGLALDGEVLVGVNYDPERDDLFEAERGAGAYLNGNRIRISERDALRDCIIGFDLPYNDIGAKHELDMLAKAVWPNMQTARIIGSSALGISYAAAGKTDLYFQHRLSPWDQVAGMLLVEEAGGVITDRTGKRATLYSDGIVASSAKLHAEFMRLTEGTAWRQPTQQLA
jgi:myo-inositol-1(or 4)-monophosphatase